MSGTSRRVPEILKRHFSDKPHLSATIIDQLDSATLLYTGARCDRKTSDTSGSSKTAVGKASSVARLIIGIGACCLSAKHKERDSDVLSKSRLVYEISIEGSKPPRLFQGHIMVLLCFVSKVGTARIQGTHNARELHLGGLKKLADMVPAGSNGVSYVVSRASEKLCDLRGIYPRWERQVEALCFVCDKLATMIEFNRSTQL
jgi:hypothetical protein